MRIYISGGITNVPNYKEHFAEAEAYLKSQGHEVINPCMIVLPESCTWKDYMKIDLCLLSLCDTIYMLKDYEQSKGARIEYGFALTNNLNIMYQESV